MPIHILCLRRKRETRVRFRDYAILFPAGYARAVREGPNSSSLDLHDTSRLEPFLRLDLSLFMYALSILVYLIAVLVDSVEGMEPLNIKV